MIVHGVLITKEQLTMITVMCFALFLLYGLPCLPKLSSLILSILRMSRFNMNKGKCNFIEIGGIKISDEDRMRHTHILGATGSGKTVLIEHLIYRDLARGYGAIIIDAKGERDLFERVRDYCVEIGREKDLKYLSSTYIEDSVRWNPCRIGNPSELQSKFFGSAKYENSFYAKACELSLLQAFNRIGNKASLTLKELSDELDRLSNHGKDDNLKGLYFDIQNLTTGEWAPILGTAPKLGNQEEVSLLDITRKNDILFLDLPTEGKAVQSSRLGALVLQEISLLSGMRKRNPGIKSDKPFSVYVDEFDAFATDPFITFLNKGRSSEFMIHLAHQTLSDLKKVSPTFEGQLMGNINNRFIFRLDVPEDAERLAKFLGTKTIMKETFQTDAGTVTGKGSTREVLEFHVHPDTIKTLQTGECVISIKTSKTLKLTKIPFLNSKTVPNPILPVSRFALSTQSTGEEKVTDPYEELTALVQVSHGGNQ
jgi:hypothetical protein